VCVEYGCVIELVTLEMTFIVVTGNEEEQKEWVEALTLASNNLTALCCDDRGTYVARTAHAHAPHTHTHRTRS